MQQYPKVSIIMGIYNCAATLSESIESIVNQSYQDWEFIICDDGSTDNSYAIAKGYCEKYANIHLIRNEKNKGLAYTLNKCLQIAKGEYIARQDGDDRSLKDRLLKQVNILESHPNYDIVSTGMAFFDEKGYWGNVMNEERPQRKDFIYHTPFCHGPSMMRKRALVSIGGYKTEGKINRVEDYNLWFRMYKNGSLGYNIQEVLYDARDDRNAIKRRKFKYRFNEAYVRMNGYRLLKLPIYSYLYALRPLIVGMIPIPIYKWVRKVRYKVT